MDSGIILISGSSSEIGKSVISKIRSMTDQKMILAQRKKVSDKTIKNAEYLFFDASNMESVINFSVKISKNYISHFIQIHGEGFPNDDLETQTLQRLENSFYINSFSNIVLIKSILPEMKKRNFGRILLIGTASSSHGGGKNSFSYGIAKQSINFLTAYLAKYYTSYNILTNCISPGMISTKFHKNSMDRSKKEIAERIKMIRLGRAGTTVEISELIYFLTFMNTYISGQNIKFDGADFI